MSRLSTFAGLEILDPGDPLATDGYQFQGRDRQTIDQWLSLVPGHRHTGAPAIANPTDPATGVTISTGGSIPANTQAYVTFTVVDQYGGETAAAPGLSLLTSDSIGSPGSALAYEVSNAAGILTINFYQYVYTLTDDSGGESLASPPITVDRVAGPASAQVVFSGMLDILAANPTATGWRLYKATGGAPYQMLGSPQGMVDGFTDDGTIAVDYATQPPIEDTTGQTGSFEVTVPSAAASAGVSFNLYLSQTEGSFLDPSLVGSYSLADAGSPIAITSLTVLSGAPPPVSTAVEQPSQIDPDTELLNWHWKGFVSASAALPSGTTGDVRLSLEEGELFAVLGASGAAGGLGWSEVAGGGGGGGPTYSFIGANGVTVNVTGATVTITGPDLPPDESANVAAIAAEVGILASGFASIGAEVSILMAGSGVVAAEITALAVASAVEAAEIVALGIASGLVPAEVAALSAASALMAGEIAGLQSETAVLMFASAAEAAEITILGQASAANAAHDAFQDSEIAALSSEVGYLTSGAASGFGGGLGGGGSETVTLTGDGGGFFGDGSDGAVSLDGVTSYPFATLSGSTYTLTRSVFATTFTVNVGVNVNTVGCIIFCTTSWLNNGSINNNGNSSGSGLTDGQPTTVVSLLGGGQSGGLGETGQGQAGTSNFGSVAGHGGSGGVGASAVGGVGGSTLGVNASATALLRQHAIIETAIFMFEAVARNTSGGGGGGGAGGAGTGHQGGGGGGGGGIIAIYSPSIVNNGSISASGGAGYIGAVAVGNGGTGGGGGGGGGIIVGYSNEPWTNAGIMNVSGGGGGSAAGAKGTNGQPGGSGVALNVVFSTPTFTITGGGDSASATTNAEIAALFAEEGYLASGVAGLGIASAAASAVITSIESHQTYQDAEIAALSVASANVVPGGGFTAAAGGGSAFVPVDGELAIFGSGAASASLQHIGGSAFVTIYVPAPGASYAQTFGDGSTLVYTITHNLGSRDLSAEVYEAAGSYRVTGCTIAFPTVNTCTLTFGAAPSVNQYRVVIQGGGTSSIGPQGIQGIQGPQGIQGSAGAVGPSGAVGATGSGVQGPAGIGLTSFSASAGTASAQIGPALDFAGASGVTVQLTQVGGSAIVTMGIGPTPTASGMVLAGSAAPSLPTIGVARIAKFMLQGNVFGAGETTWTLEHGLGTMQVIVQAQSYSGSPPTPYIPQEVDWTPIDANNIQVAFASPPGVGVFYFVTVVG